MKNNQYTIKPPVPFTCAPPRELARPVEVHSTNQHNFTIITQHIYESGAAQERSDRLAQGHTDIK